MNYNKIIENLKEFGYCVILYVINDNKAHNG